MFRDEKTRYPGIYQRTHESGKVVYIARARVKGVGEASRTFRRLTDAKVRYVKQIVSMQQRDAVGSVVSIWLNEAEAEALRLRAETERRPESSLVREALRRFLAIER
jgi:hypothetical protein